MPNSRFPPISQNLVNLMRVSLHTSPEYQIEDVIRFLLRHKAHIITQFHDLDPTIEVLNLSERQFGAFQSKGQFIKLKPNQSPMYVNITISSPTHFLTS